MGDIVAINHKVAQESRHLQGDAICAACKHEWVAVAPIGTVELECPNCHTWKGLFANPVAPFSEVVYECDCGGQIFFITPDGASCYVCGLEHTF